MTPLREAVLSLLPEARGIFLRCDRGGSLYVTNAPSRTQEKIDWKKAGFYSRSDEKLTFLIPDAGWIARFEEVLLSQVRDKRLWKMLGAAKFGETLEGDMELFIEGVKRLELKGNPHEYEKMIRQRAAVCLREKKGGGALACCALIVDFMNEGGCKDED